MQSDVKKTLKILKSLGANYPVIRSLGYELKKPILAIVACDEVKFFMDSLSVYNAAKISEFAKIRDIEKVLRDTSLEYVFFPYSQSKKGKEQAEYLIDAMKLGAAGAIPLVIADRKIQRESMASFFTVYMDGRLEDIYLPMEEVVPTDGQLAVVFDRVYGLEMKGKTQEERALLAAACFLYPMLHKANKEGEFRELLNCVDVLVKQDEDGDSANLAELFVEEVYRWQERTCFHDVFALPRLEMQVAQRLDEVILFDSKYLYMQEKLLEKIAHGMLDHIPVSILKAALSDVKILIAENTATYTVKVNYYNIAGNYERVRMLRFDREAFHRWGEMEFIDLCMAGKEMYDEN